MVSVKTFGSSSAGNSYLLKDGDSALLLEAGIQPKKLKTDWSKVDALLITHEHMDHARYTKDYIRRGGFSVYCTPGTAKELNGVSKHRIMGVDYLKQFTVKGWQILAFQVEHDTAQPSGFLIQTPSGKKVLFATDTYYIRYKFNGVTHFLIECNYSMDILLSNVNQGLIDRGQYKRIMRSHFELSNLINFFEVNDLSKAEEIYLLHLSDRNSDEQYFISEVEKATGIPTYIAGGDD